MGLSDFFGELISDIRQKLVEEPWFGREVTPPAEMAKHEQSSDLGWLAWRDAEPPAESTPQEPQRGHDFDR